MKSIIKFPFYAKASLIIIGLFAFIGMLFIAQKIIVPIIYSTIIAIVLSPIVNFFVRKKMNRILAISITLFVVIVTSILIVTLLSTQMMQFANSFPAMVAKLHLLLDNLIKWTSVHFHVSTTNINVWVDKKNGEILNDISTTIAQTIITTGSLLVVLILVLVYTFMILYYQPLLIEFIHKLFSTSNTSDINGMLLATRKIIKSYLVGLIIEAMIVAGLNVSCLLIIGIDYAILLGIIGALLNAIPFIGGIIAVALPMSVAIATKSSGYALLVLISYIVIQFFDNHYIIPKVVASKVQINALVSVFVVMAGGALWGIPGMFLSIPLTAIIKLILDRIEPLKPWGYLLGDTMPPILNIKMPFKKKAASKPIK